ncbi:MAG: SpoIIE family protein phosphatase [Caldilineaceae bacterium]|nr:SpoIIE family protein phosphatase [Caldilineaceae bacterium]
MTNLQVERVQILLVHSDETVRTRMSLILGQQGHETTLATTGRLGLDRLKKSPPNIVCLGGQLTDMTAQRFLSEMKENDALAATAVLVIVDADETDNIDTCLQLGAQDYLIQPFTPAMLTTRIQKLHVNSSADHLYEDDMLVKLEHDMQIARRIQAGFLPDQLPEPDGWEVAARFQPAREVAGDFYDAFMMSQNRRVGFVIADVVDKGVPAALFMALVRSLTRAFAQQNYSLSWADVLDDNLPKRRGSSGKRRLPSTGSISLYNAVLLTNNYILENHLKDNMFATLFFGMLDPANGQLTYINAGHNPPFIMDSTGTITAALNPSGPAVGMFPGVEFNIEYAQLNPGDMLYAYTDGVTEARNPAGDFVTEAHLKELLSSPATSAANLLDRVDGYLKEFIADAVQFDDITMMAIYRQPDNG